MAKDKVEKLLKMKKDYEEACEKQGHAIVKEIVKDLFEKCPEIEAVKWTQYTPYFNDGDKCVFNVHDPEFLISIPIEESKVEVASENEEEDEYDAYEEDWKSPWDFEYENKNKKGKYSKELIAAIKEFSEIHGQMTDVFQICFGDHVQVVCNKKKIKVEEYSHD